MTLKKNYLIFFFSISLIIYPVALIFSKGSQNIISENSTNDIELIIPTFLGNWQRNFYGSNPPDTLAVIWKLYLGEGETVISRKIGSKKWKGAGWTGQPLLIKENDQLLIIQGAYDHHLKKIQANTGKIIWQYAFDDVIKGTGSIWNNRNAASQENEYIILQGSRLGVGNYLDSKHIPSFRAVSVNTGEELWRLDVKFTPSYSRDADGSALILNDTAYLGLENSLFTIIDPDPDSARIIDGMLQPKILAEHDLYTSEDVAFHKNNIVTEASPALLGNKIYIASGSGHVFGYNMHTKKIDWDFYIGSDIDGTPVITYDSCILVSIEKQYIKGPGGVIKLNPSKTPDEAVEWFFPTENKEYSSWEGGVIGSVGINDYYRREDEPHLAAFTGIDGNMYVVEHDSITNQLNPGFDSTTYYPAPNLVYKKYIGPSISTPVIIGHRIVAAGYGGIFLFDFNSTLHFKLLDRLGAAFEATPIVYDRKIYIASRNGYLYCLGEE